MLWNANYTHTCHISSGDLTRDPMITLNIWKTFRTKISTNIYLRINLDYRIAINAPCQYVIVLKYAEVCNI